MQKSRGLRQKLDALHVQIGQSLLEYQGFGRELICYMGTSFFKLIWTPDIFCVPIHHSKRRHQFSTLSNKICYFQSFTDLFRELNDHEIENHYKMNSENVETWHGIIISPTWNVQNSREGYGRNWTHFVYKLENLFRSIRVSDENSSVTRALHFLNLFELQTFFAFRTHHSRRRHQFFNTFWHHLLFFSHLPICLES